ncbi:hypothetical protein B0T21DRAFT_353874, partial [Apiosordaria backusii]
LKYFSKYFNKYLNNNNKCFNKYFSKYLIIIKNKLYKRIAKLYIPNYIKVYILNLITLPLSIDYYSLITLLLSINLLLLNIKLSLNTNLVSYLKGNIAILKLFKSLIAYLISHYNLISLIAYLLTLVYILLYINQVIDNLNPYIKDIKEFILYIFKDILKSVLKVYYNVLPINKYLPYNKGYYRKLNLYFIYRYLLKSFKVIATYSIYYKVSIGFNIKAILKDLKHKTIIYWINSLFIIFSSFIEKSIIIINYNFKYNIKFKIASIEKVVNRPYYIKIKLNTLIIKVNYNTLSLKLKVNRIYIFRLFNIVKGLTIYLKNYLKST